MAQVELVMPKMGESIMEGTILKWLKKEGELVKQDEPILEVATDKVDTEVPSLYAGKIIKFLRQEGEIVQIGLPIAILETDINAESSAPTISAPIQVQNSVAPAKIEVEKAEVTSNLSHRFYSPLVLNIAKEENISMAELENITGTGKENRVTKTDILDYIQNKKNQVFVTVEPKIEKVVVPVIEEKLIFPVKEDFTQSVKPATSFGANVEIIEMDRMRKMIAERMLDSQRISAHVTSYVEADVTNIVFWRNRIKQEFLKKENDALTLTPIFIEALAKAFKDYPLMNASVVGDKIIVKKEINIGMAVALSNGNLIVPVIKNADQLNIVGLTKKVNELARKARENKLTPDDLAEGTYTMSNVGSFGNVMGTPIILQPQIGIMAFGAVQKKPAVVETEFGDAIGIRHLMYLSHSYDHRVVDGSLGGMFVRRVADYLERFDVNRKIW